ncbi:MAG: hypothetical protein ACP5M8_07750, partial [Caldisphaera sp.]
YELPPSFMLYFVTPLLAFLTISYYRSSKILEKKLIIIYLIGMLGIFYEEQTTAVWLLLLLLFFWLIFSSKNIRTFLKLILSILALAVSGAWLILYFYVSSIVAYFAGAYGVFSGYIIGLFELIVNYNSFPILSGFTYFVNDIHLAAPAIMIYALTIISALAVILTLISFLVNGNWQVRKILLYDAAALLILLGLLAGIFNLSFVYTENLSRIGFMHLGLILTGITYMMQFIFIGYPIMVILSISSLFALIYYMSSDAKHRKFRAILASIIMIGIILSSVATGYYTLNVGYSYKSNLAGTPPGKISNVFHIPSYFTQLGNFLEKNNGYNNLVILPVDADFSGEFLYNGTGEAANIMPLSDYIHGELVDDVLSSFMVQNLVYFPSSNITNFANYLRLLGVKYIILNTASYPGPGAVAKPWWPYPGAFPWNYTEFEYYLNKTPNLSYVKSFGPFLVYKVNGEVPLVYASNGIPGNYSPTQIFWLYSSGKINACNTSLIDAINAPKINNVSSSNVNVQYNIISKDIYKAQIHAQTAYYLILDQGYGNWNVYLNGSLYDARHYLANGYANAWLMPKGNYTVTIINGYHQFYINTFILSILGFFALIIAVYNDKAIFLIRALSLKFKKR